MMSFPCQTVCRAIAALAVGAMFGCGGKIDKIESTAPASSAGGTGGSASAEGGVVDVDGAEAGAAGSDAGVCGTLGTSCCELEKCHAGLVCDAGVCMCEATPELCNGLDDDCDGVVDDDAGCAAFGAGAVCQSGLCACPTGQMLCAGSCISVEHDWENCGGCGNVCPVACSGGSCVVAATVAVGNSHACALLSNGTVRCWGDNSMGQLGSAGVSSSVTPVPVIDLENVTAITAGGCHNCAVISGGSVKCWGCNDHGELGDGSTDDKPSPTEVAGLSPVVEISCGPTHTCAVTSSGQIACWGGNSDGQLGTGGPSAPVPSPTVVPGLNAAIGVAAGLGRTFVTLKDGTVECWGSHADGVCTLSPPAVVEGFFGAAEVAVGAHSACAAYSDGTVTCFGYNSTGQLGHGGLLDSVTPVEVWGVGDAIRVGAGDAHACALLEQYGGVRCWGNNANGELGQGFVGGYSTLPVQVSGIDGAKWLALGATTSCAGLSNGSVECWGTLSNGSPGVPTVVTF
jgi:Regulator of chromosome condensation (RCC1) repeat